MTNFELQINDSEGFLAFVETLKTNRSSACMSVPIQVGARALQLSNRRCDCWCRSSSCRTPPRHGRGEPERRSTWPASPRTPGRT